MPSESRCTRCGKAVETSDSSSVNEPVATLCAACTAWYRALASDQEDRQDATGLGDIRTRSRPPDSGSQR
jgi:hypothetical protein